MAVLPVPQLRPLNAGQGLRDIGAGVQGAIQGGMQAFQTGRKMEQEAAKEVRDVNRAKLDDQIKQDKINAEKARIERDIKTREGRKKLAEDAIEAYQNTIYEGEDSGFVIRNVEYLRKLPVETEEDAERILKTTVNMDADSRSRVALRKADIQHLNYPTNAYSDKNFKTNLDARDKEVFRVKNDGIVTKMFADLKAKGVKNFATAWGTVAQSDELPKGYLNPDNIKL